LCINPECTSILLSGEPNCPKCPKAHVACPKIDLSGITHMLNDKVSQFRELVLQVSLLENAFLQNMQQARMRLVKEFCLKGYSYAFDCIYGGKESKDLTGKDVRKFFERLVEEDKNKEERAKVLLEDYGRRLKKINEEIG
jgi:hypothetical protein